MRRRERSPGYLRRRHLDFDRPPEGNNLSPQFHGPLILPHFSGGRGPSRSDGGGGGDASPGIGNFTSTPILSLESFALMVA